MTRLPSLVFAAKISQLLHFVAKIYHSHCSSIFPRFQNLFHGFLEFFMVFFNCSMVFFDCFIVFLHFSDGFLQVFYVFLQFVYICFSFSFDLFSLIVPECSLNFTWFSLLFSFLPSFLPGKTPKSSTQFLSPWVTQYHLEYPRVSIHDLDSEYPAIPTMQNHHRRRPIPTLSSLSAHRHHTDLFP